jgi:putative DNA primase/helicase
MTLLVGRRNVVSPGLTGLSATFGLEQMLDKQGALFSDTRLTKRADQGPIIEFILKVTGKDQITIQRKFLPAVSGTLPLRLVVLANELPAFLDPTGVLASRFLLYRFRQSFYGREDRGLTAKLAAEVSGILNWALDGLDRLRETGRFGQPASGVEELWHWQDRVNPVGRFVRTGCVLDPSAEVKRDTLFLAYSDWNEAKKAGGPTLLEAFGRKLKAVFPITEYRPWADPPAPRPRYYRGIREMSHKEREAAEDSE